MDRSHDYFFVLALRLHRAIPKKSNAKLENLHTAAELSPTLTSSASLLPAAISYLLPKILMILSCNCSSLNLNEASERRQASTQLVSHTRRLFVQAVKRQTKSTIEPLQYLFDWYMHHHQPQPFIEYCHCAKLSIYHYIIAGAGENHRIKQTSY